MFGNKENTYGMDPIDLSRTPMIMDVSSDGCYTCHQKAAAAASAKMAHVDDAGCPASPPPPPTADPIMHVLLLVAVSVVVSMVVANLCGASSSSGYSYRGKAYENAVERLLRHIR